MGMTVDIPFNSVVQKATCVHMKHMSARLSKAAVSLKRGVCGGGGGGYTCCTTFF